MQFGESIMVIVILVFILMVGLIFYYNVSKTSIEREVDYREDVREVELAKQVLALPEVRCDAATGRGEGCIDLLRLQAMQSLMASDESHIEKWVHPFYEHQLGYASVNLHIVTGPDAGGTYTLYHDEPAGTFEGDRSFFFTSIYDPFLDAEHFGYLNVTRYRRVEVAYE